MTRRASKSSLAPQILFEDPHLAVVNKPAGMLSQGEASGEDNLVDWFRRYWGRPYVGLVHRLDRNTSGLLVVAKRSKAAERLTRALQEGALKRDYQALLVGALERPAQWQDWVLKDEVQNLSRVVQEGRAGAKWATLEVKPLKTIRHNGSPLTLAELVLQTGRSHQIRVQAAHHGYPLLGDVKYGSAGQESTKAFPRPALHSARLRFPHPMSGQTLSYEAPLPEDMALVLRG